MINYDKQFNNKIRKVVKQFNAKVRRLESQGVKYLPSTTSVADLKTTYFERDALKRRLRQLEQFSAKGAEEIVKLRGGAKLTKWELGVTKSDMAYLKRRYTDKMTNYGNIVPRILGKEQAVSYARMGDPHYENLKVLKKSLDKDLNKMTQSEMTAMRKKTRNQMRRYNRQKYVLWANYFTFLEDIAYKADIDPELLESVKEKLEKMDIDEFIKFFETEKAFSSIIEYYDLQKMKSGGYSDADIETVQLLFTSINQLADEYMK